MFMEISASLSFLFSFQKFSCMRLGLGPRQWYILIIFLLCAFYMQEVNKNQK